MSVVMYDSVTAGDIPVSAQAVAGYVDGDYAWSSEDWARFAGVRHVQIAVTFTDAGDCLDIEKGDATIGQAPAWVGARQKAGVKRPWLYIDRADFDELLRTIAAGVTAGMCTADVGYFVADWTGGSHTIAGADAVQFADPPKSGGEFDLSVVYGYWPDGTPADTVPQPVTATTEAAAPKPQPTGGDDVTLTEISAGTTATQPTKAAQTILNVKAGAGLSVDGIFGNQTELAVKAWQHFFGLSVDGVVGPSTWAVLIDL